METTLLIAVCMLPLATLLGVLLGATLAFRLVRGLSPLPPFSVSNLIQVFKRPKNLPQAKVKGVYMPPMKA